jgi:hypothetical protein
MWAEGDIEFHDEAPPDARTFTLFIITNDRVEVPDLSVSGDTLDLWK